MLEEKKLKKELKVTEEFPQKDKSKAQKRKNDVLAAKKRKEKCVITSKAVETKNHAVKDMPLGRYSKQSRKNNPLHPETKEIRNIAAEIMDKESKKQSNKEIKKFLEEEQNND